MKEFFANCVFVIHLAVFLLLVSAPSICSHVKIFKPYLPWAKAFVFTAIIIQLAFNFACPLTILEWSLRGKPAPFKSYLAFYLQRLFGWTPSELSIFVASVVFLLGPIAMIAIRSKMRTEGL